MGKTVIPPTPSRAEYMDQGAGDTSWLRARDPLALFETWLAEAGQSEEADPNAMSLASVDAQGCPDVRIVLLKGLSEAGFVFYTNVESAKADQLSGNAQAALCFHWKSNARQVRVRGAVRPVAPEVSDAYFATRARGSQIGAWASKQSRPVASREVMVDAVQAVEAHFEGQDVARPPHWQGWCVALTPLNFGRRRRFDFMTGLSFPKTRLQAGHSSAFTPKG